MRQVHAWGVFVLCILTTSEYQIINSKGNNNMKRILLGTTTLIGAAVLFAGAASADTPKVTIGGYENFEAGWESDNLNKPSGSNDYFGTGSSVGVPKQRPDAFRSDTEVSVKIDGKSDMGLGYGGEVDLLADTSLDVQGRGINASKTFIYLEKSPWGRIELGSNVGADGTMKIDAGTIARATGGIDGDWSYFANANHQYLAMSALPLGYGALFSTDGVNNYTGLHTEENLDKITYYTPRFAGFQVGVSFLPDQVNRGQGALAADTGSIAPYGPDRYQIAGQSDNIFTGGISYDNKFDQIGVALAATGEHGVAEMAGYEDLQAWNVGGKLSYLGFSLAASYGDWGKSNTLISADSKDTNYYTAGGAYEYGPFGISVTYLHSTFDCGNGSAGFNTGGNTISCTTGGKDKFNNISVGTDYKLAPGLTPYAEVSFFDENPANSAGTSLAAVGANADNKGTVGIIGTQLNF
jgi:hypothetical protein